jgi:mRNA interferase MazF
VSGVVALRGEIWEIDLNPRKGREQKGIRPCLVVSTDGMNRSRFGTIIVCPVTTTERKNFVWRPRVDPGDLRVTDASWTARPHWVETDQILTVDVGARVVRQLAVVVNPERMVEVDAWLGKLLLPPRSSEDAARPLTPAG